MKLIVLFAAVVGVALGGRIPGPEEPTAFNYHEKIGIPAAARIKALEEAKDFDGSRIGGGSPSPLGAHPYLGGLLVVLTTGSTSMCSTTLLTNTKSITAAHCWFDGKNQGRSLTVILGSVHLFYGGTRINTNEVVTHESWNPSTVQNDVAIVTFFWVNFSNHIHSIQLPSGSDTYAGTWATAAGFGSQSSIGAFDWDLAQHQVNLQVITNQVCANTFGDYVVSSTICTSGEGGKGPCSGDSGGPLVITSGNTKTLIGVVSFISGFGCLWGRPAGYARVTSFVPWIQNRL